MYIPVFEVILYSMLKKCIHYEKIGFFCEYRLVLECSCLVKPHTCFEIANKYIIAKAQNYVFILFFLITEEIIIFKIIVYSVRCTL